ncbi:MAG TPA: hypothetical protein V6D17_22415 [Candidatus Obscuribacterales bacterium]
MKRIALVMSSALAAGCALGALESVYAQGFQQHNPNLNHFYMARQQWTITDDAPVVDDRRTNPTPGAAGAGALPAARPALPRATWMPYSQSIPSLSNSLPKVNNGVPPKEMPAAPVNPGMKGKAGKLTASKSKGKTKTASTPSVKTYEPYKGYGAPPALTRAPGASTSGSNQVAGYGDSSMQSSTAVRGSVLHWARVKRRSLE